jgi:hypothetical protein
MCIFSNAGLGFKKLEVVSKAVNFEVFFRRTPNVECPLASRTGHGYFAGRMDPERVLP